MTSRQFAVLCALAVAWGCSFLFVKVIVDAGIDPLGMSAARTFLGALTLIPFAWAARAGFRQPRAAWLGMLALGLFNFAIPWTLFGVAGQHVPSGVSAVANAATPLWSAILATVLLKSESLGPRRIAGLGIGFAGVLVLMAGDFNDLSWGETGSILLILVATLCYACSAVSIRKWLSGVPSVPLATVQVATASALLFPVAIGTGAYAGADWEANVVASLFALGALGSGLAVVAYMYLIRNVGPVRASVVTYMVPPIGVFLGWAVLDEQIGWNLAFALVLILSGVALVQGVTVGWLRARITGGRPALAPSE